MISKRKLAVGAGVLVLMVGVPVVVNRLTVRPAAALVKRVFEAGTLVKPGPGYAQVKAAVTVTKSITIPVAGAPAAIIDVYTPKTAGPRPIVLWVHGGGFISGDRTQVTDYATMLADQGFTVASLEYSLAPGQKYPVPIQQGTAALNYLAANGAQFGGDPQSIAVGGDSAGAQIASELAAVQTNPALARAVGVEAKAKLKATVLFCGLYDMDTVGKTGFPALRTYLWAYTGHHDWTTYPRIDELSTTRQATASYPATFISVGNVDPFQSQAYELDAVLRAQGVHVESRYWTGDDVKLSHEYQFDFRTQQARDVFAQTVTFLKSQLT